MATATSTTTATMRPSQRILLEAFPAPPSHIPSPPGPPPSAPPALPLPPVPGPSRVSVDEQLLFLARRSIASHRDSLNSQASAASRRASLVSLPPRSPTFLLHPAEHHPSRLLSDIEDDESDPVPARMPSPFLDSSWRRSKHHHNESISSIDVRAILADQPPDDLIHPPPLLATSSSSNSLSSPLASSDTSLSDISVQHLGPSLTVKDIRLERRAERTKSPGLKMAFTIRSRSRSRPRAAPPIPEPMPSNLPTKKDDMTLDELGPLPSSSAITFPHQMSPHPSSSPPRTPSPDIDSILCKTPRPALRKSASQSRLRPQSTIRALIDSTSNPEYRRRASEGVLRDARSPPSWQQQQQRSRALSHGSVLAEGDSDDKRTGSDDKTGEGDESDSSIDLHTPLPHLMVRDGLLSSNSRLLPTSTRRPNGRSDSVTTTCSTFTKSGIMKDERDTPMRRVRHRDNRLLKGGIGLTTGLGWSDSEDEDAPSPLTRRLSTLNLSRRSSASSVRTTSSSIISHRHPLSRSYSSGALIESLEEDPDEQQQQQSTTTTIVVAAPPSAPRPRLPSAGRLSRPPGLGLPPTSWLNNKGATAIQTGSTRTSTSSTFSIDTTLSEGMPPPPSRSRPPSKLGRPSAFRDSSASSENYHNDRSQQRRIGHPTTLAPGVDRTSSSTTASSTLSTGIPATPRDYDPSLSSPAGFGILAQSYNREKSLPPLPNNSNNSLLVKKRPSHPRIDNLSNFNFPRVRTFSSTTSPSSPTSPTPSPSLASPVRPLHLPRQAARADRPPVPVPSVPFSSSSASSLSNSPTSPSALRLPVPLRSPLPDAASTPANANVGLVRPRPRTGTGMVYRTTSGSRLRAPMTMTLAASSPSSTTTTATATTTTTGLSVVGSLGRVKIPPV